MDIVYAPHPSCCLILSFRRLLILLYISRLFHLLFVLPLPPQAPSSFFCPPSRPHRSDSLLEMRTHSDPPRSEPLFHATLVSGGTLVSLVSP